MTGFTKAASWILNWLQKTVIQQAPKKSHKYIHKQESHNLNFPALKNAFGGAGISLQMFALIYCTLSINISSASWYSHQDISSRSDKGSEIFPCSSSHKMEKMQLLQWCLRKCYLPPQPYPYLTSGFLPLLEWLGWHPGMLTVPVQKSTCQSLHKQF